MKSPNGITLALLALAVAGAPAAAAPFPTPIAGSSATVTVTLRPDFFSSGIGNLAHLENCRIHLQTGGTSRFEPSSDLAGLGASTQTFQVPAVDEDIEAVVGYNRRFDVVPCSQWGLQHPGSNPRDCPHYKDDPVTAHFHLKMDVNDLNEDSSGVRGSFAGTNLVLEIRFEENGKELSGVVSKRVAGVADVSFPFKGDLGSTRAKLTFALSASNGALAVSFASLAFDTNVSLDAYDRSLPQSLMDKVKLRDQFLASARPRIEAAIRSSGLPASLQRALASLIQIGGIRRVISVAAGAHGGANVIGTR
ncbi:MAG: hypothetical protein ABI768_10330 [Acidobacteriota bacterium]